MTATVYTSTATKAKTKSATVFAFGRRDDFAGKPTSEGGYYVFKLCKNYAGHVRGGIAKTWRYIAKDLSHADAIDLLNKRVKHTAFNHAQ